MARFKMPSFGGFKKAPDDDQTGASPAKPSGAKSKQISAVLTQTGSREAWWDVGVGMQITSGQPSSSAPERGIALSFGTNDKELVQLPGSPAALAQEFIDDVADEVSHYKIRQGKPNKKHTGAWRGINSTCIYATPRARFEGESDSLKIIPGVAALRALLAKTSAIETMQTPFVTGVLFGGPDESTQVMVLYLCTDEGDLTKFDYVPITGGDPSAAIKLFVQTNRLSSSGEWDENRVAIFTGAEIEEVVGKLGSYPSRDRYLGMSVDLLTKGGAVVVGVSLVSILLYSGWLTYESNAIKTKNAQNVKALKDEQASLKQRLSGPRFGALIERKTVNVEAVLAQANAVWKEGALVRVVAKQGLTELTVLHPIKDKVINQEEIASVIRHGPPEGCERVAIESNPQMNELTVKYECKKPDPYLRLLDSVGG